MPATDQELRAIAFVAVRCRPHGARQWDEGGVYAKLAEVRDRSVGSIAIAAIQAAEDRNAITPGVIPAPGPHWRTPEAAPITTADRVDPAKHCAGCGKPKLVCQTRLESQRGMDPDDARYDDHVYVPVGAVRSLKRSPKAAADTVEHIKGDLQPMREPAHAEDRPSVRNPAAGRARRALMHAPDQTEETTDE